MSVRKTSFVNGEYYHLYNRGNSKQVIFHDDQDHKYFMNLMDIMNNENRFKTRFVKSDSEKQEYLVSIGAFCLMPNHFHLLVKQEKENGITLFMQKLSTAYVMYYNKKYKRTGGLFEGKFKAKFAGDDRYLKYLFSYIHLNPLKIIEPNWKLSPIENKSYEFLMRYPYSSFSEYYSGKFIYVNNFSFPVYFPTRDAFVKDLNSWFRIGF